MGESACLLRSFSHPSSASREAKEGNPILALTESISFGRFMSESLAWEKWSTFSHNRFLEEVEHFSKPGSVAQKKAYFEAYYKKRAAMKAAALLEQANTASNDVSEVQAADDAPGSSNVNLEFSKATNYVIINEQDEGIVDGGLVHSSDANALYADGQMDNSQNAKVEGDEVIGEKNVEVENSIHVANSKQIENADDCDIIVAILSTSTRLRAETNATPNSKKSAGQLVGEKGVTSKSIHMSINFASRLQDTSKSSVRVSPENPTRGSVHGASKLLPSIFQRSQDRRSKSELNKSVSGKNTPVEISQILSSDCLKSSSAKGSKSRPPLISSPFSFRSEERVAKRREFFQKLGEKNNAKEDTGKKHLHARPKEKAEHDLKKLRQSAVFRGKPSDDLHRGLQSPNNSMKKIPLTRPRSPKLGRKSTPNAVQEASLQLRQRASVNTETSKLVIQKSNHSSTCTVTLLPKKKACENASPNTQW
ncbi:TPX2 (TARGETING PROTEIN FOR XKLP2) PROTEIN FAMILY [Salix koriyanagi]|uniref:TPX2 (TARGETING PROTEIN FOR XKLP2) PROTEIN FAMILY n=1 Tax=Salix koriyanagi TaxID=2511006 RepID=A0A9Q0WPH5_9ROSI|nr:TPX2 (TARGETING PROTEIN FOR XKLP2) PROTEIN FAMILY [Salix koriyanagi]